MLQFSRETTKIIILTIDRFEEDLAICLDDTGRTLSLPRCYFPTLAREGDVYELVFTPTPEQRDERRREIRNLFEKLKYKEKL